MRVTEQTLEQELARIIGERLRVSIITQPSIAPTKKKTGKKGRKQLDTLLTFPNERIVIEVEVGASNLLVGVAQAEDYVQEIRADGSITIAYPDSARREVETQQDIIDIVTGTNFSALVLTPFLRQSFKSINLDEFCKRIDQAREQPEPTDLNLVLSVLRQAVESVSLRLRRRKGIKKPALEKVINQFDLFSALAGRDEKVDENELELAASDLSAYIIVNQILLYFLLQRTLSLTKFLTIDDFSELRQYFKKITDIDYKAVYGIDVIGDLPRNCIADINRIILAFRGLKPEGVQHDLLGRMFHEFLPFKTRKIFATFYTKPVAAELLARLAITHPDYKVIDPACGSGTLMVAAYKALRVRDPRQSHNQTLRKVYALDIMPFASHLAALNLTLQDLDAQTDVVNVGVGNSLNIVDPSSPITSQHEIFERVFSRRVDVDRAHNEEIHIPQSLDLVIMNPPFTDRGRLNDSMLGNRIGDYIERQNYWAYFLTLSNDLIKPGGIIAAVLPRLFLAGSTSKEVRKKIFCDYGYKALYLVRTTKEFAFSEAAAFRDFLVVLQKPLGSDLDNAQPCKVVYLNKSLDEITITDAGDIADTIWSTRTPKDIIETDDFTLFTVPQDIIQKGSDNLWFTIGFEDPKNAATITKVWSKLLMYSSSKLTALRNAVGAKSSKLIAQLIPRGFEAKPSGLYTSIFAVRRLDDARVSAKDLVILKERKETVSCSFRTKTFDLPKTKLQLGIKTASYFRRLIVTPEYGDWVIGDRFPDSANINRLNGIKMDYGYVKKSIELCKAHLIVARRLNVAAPGSTFLSFYSEQQIVSPKTFYSVRCSKQKAKIFNLWINSIFGVIQLLQKRMETEGGYCEILKEDLIEFLVPTESSLPPSLERWFNKNLDTEFPSLSEQFTELSPRRELDREMMLWMGWQEAEVDKDLDELYNALAGELKLLKGKAINLE